MSHPSVNLVSSTTERTHGLTISLHFQHCPRSLSPHCVSAVALLKPATGPETIPGSSSLVTQNKIQRHSWSYKTLCDRGTHILPHPPSDVVLLPVPLPSHRAPATLSFLLFPQYSKPFLPLGLCTRVRLPEKCPHRLLRGHLSHSIKTSAQMSLLNNNKKAS